MTKLDFRFHCTVVMVQREVGRRITARPGSKDYGYFSITPYFHSFQKPPARVRKEHYSYLLGLAHAALGDADKAGEYFRTVLDENSSHQGAALELEKLQVE